MSKSLGNIKFECFPYTVKVLLLAFVKYTLSQRNSSCSRNCIFWYFLGTGDSYFMTKNCSKSSYID